MAKSIREAAMDYLSRREHSTHELLQKLLAKDFAAEEVHAAVERLAQQGLLSDERFTEAYVNYRRQRGCGPYKINAELRQKGVSEALINQYLNERDNAWFNMVEEVRVKKFGPGLPVDIKEKARQVRFLQQRGFTHDQVYAVLS